MKIEIPQNVVYISSEVEECAKDVVKKLQTEERAFVHFNDYPYDVREAVGEMFKEAGYFCYWWLKGNFTRGSVIISKREMPEGTFKERI